MRTGLIAVLCAALLGGAAIAHAESVQSGKLVVSFGGKFTPHSLPRDRDVPVQVNLEGSVKTTDGSTPPPLRRMSIAVNRYGRLSVTGLPLCPSGVLESTSSEDALKLCGPALVGRGSFGANLSFPNLPPQPIDGRMIAFNSRVGGRPVILLHIHASSPAPATVVLVFEISHRKSGKFGTVMETKIPEIAADIGYVTDISLKFGREYTYGGKRRSFLSARCAAPAGFPGALFTFARGTFEFAGKTKVTTSLTRDCVVR